uniref:TIR domain-containing protein n=1 Tax=Macrostomum lignano TaxID=282301 RepID=A0A1I8H3D3_9PLAT
ATAQPRPLIEYLSWLYEFYGQMGKFKMTEKQLTGYREKAGAKLAEFQGLIDSLSRCASTYSSSIVMTLSVSFCVTLSKSEFFFTEMVIPALVGWYDKQDQELAKATVNSLLGLTYNMFFKNNSEIYDVLSRVGVVDSVKPYLKSSDVELQVHALILIAFALDESQADLYLGAKEVMEFLVGHLADSISRPDRRSKGYHTIELAQCVNRLALNDVNKTLLMETDLLPALLRMCSGGREDEVAAGLDILFTLSFLPANRERILAEFGDCLRVLMADQTQRQDGRGRWREARSLQGLDFNLDEQLSNPTAASRGSGDSKPGQSAASHRPQTARQLRRRATSTDPETVPACVLQGEHVMISYQHECKATVARIKEALAKAGIRVWIDYERMGEGSTLSAMADAVECSYAVLMCMSRKYKDSNNCRVEAEYAWRLGKKVVPLLLEQKYKPTGWLGLMLGANLYYDFSGKYSFDVKINELLRVLSEARAASKIVHEPAEAAAAAAASSSVGAAAPVKAASARPVGASRPSSAASLGSTGREYQFPSAYPTLPPISASSTAGGAGSRTPGLRSWSADETQRWAEERSLNLAAAAASAGKLAGEEMHFLCGCKRSAPEAFYRLLDKFFVFESLHDLAAFANALDDL